MSIRIGEKKYSVHRLIALTFHREPKNKDYVVDHIDRDGFNNVPSNLEWVTHKENIQRAVSKEIVKLTFEGEFVEEFKSAIDEGDKTGIISSGISSACRGKLKSIKGYQWMYKKDYDKNRTVKRYEKKVRSKPVVQLSVDGEFLAEFSSAREVQEKIKILPSLIS